MPTTPTTDKIPAGEKAQSSRRREREQAPPAEAKQSAVPKAEPATLETILGQGRRVHLAGKGYELAPFPLSKMREAQELMGLWPQVILFAGFTDPAENGDELDAEKVAQILSALNTSLDEEAVVTGEQVYKSIAHLATTIDEEQINAIADFVVLALSRKQPEVTREDIVDDLDIPTALRLLREVFAVNGGMKQRLFKP